MKKILFLFLLLYIGCSTTSEMVITPTTNIKNPDISCMRKFLVSQEIFEDEFIYNNDFPEVILYPKKYTQLSDKEKENALNSAGKKWQECNPSDMRPLTLWLYDKNGNIITVIFIIRE